jgi:uncharacterized protein DUF5916/cellulose/xylan binding protein with CBM9 domain
LPNPSQSITHLSGNKDGNVARTLTLTAVQLLVVVLGSGANESPVQARLPPRSVPIAAVAEHLTLDGRLDEHAWTQDIVLRDLIEVSPADLGRPPARTEARFLYDDRNIYVGIRAFDPDPRAIRTALVRRDHVQADQDYIEVVLDPEGSGRTGMLFRVNSHGIQTDGLFNEDTQLRDYSPDFNFDAATSVDADGWQAEIRIPLSTLHYTENSGRSWRFLVFRNWPRQQVVLMSSAAIPRASACTLCFANEFSKLQLAPHRSPLLLTPQLTYSRTETHDQGRIGADLKWQPRPNTSLDVTIKPDFSQVEADDLQLSANTRFALALKEKRSFFLEGVDLLQTPISAVYTRAFVNPEGGFRITHRGSRDEYTTMLLRDAGGGLVLEPGPQFSQTADQEGYSDAFVGRYRRTNSDSAWGVLSSGRWYADGSHNFIFGTDASWVPNSTDRVGAQFLWSQTRDPNRPDLLPAWVGREYDGKAGALSWQHVDSAWFTSLNYSSYSPGFRTWNGFVPQVGISDAILDAGLYFYPRSNSVTRIAPRLSFSQINQTDGTRLTRLLGPGLELNAARDTQLLVFWYPSASDTGPKGVRTYDNVNLSLISSPFSWMPQASLTAIVGTGLDYSTGDVVDSQSWQVSVPLRLFNHLELGVLAAYQQLKSRTPDHPREKLLSERDLQLSATWYFSRRLYVYGAYQSVRTELSTDPSASPSRTETRRRSFLVNYQLNWQTRYYLGLTEGDSGREIFGKFSYAFSLIQ